MTPVPPVVDGQLSWGYWLRLERKNQKPVYYDPAGASWDSIRDCFFRGRLRMTTTHPMDAGKLLELLLATMIAIVRGRRSHDPAFEDMFGGKEDHARHFLHWMQAERLAEGEAYHQNWKLTPEGSSAMRMLFATRPHAIGAIRPSRASLLELTRLSQGPDMHEADRVEVERKASGWPAAFLRRRVGNGFGIVAVRRDETDHDVQVGRTVWNVTFHYEDQRDALYDFLIERLDRWPEWVTMAYGSRGEELTLRLLTLALAHARAVPPPGPSPEPD